MASNPSLTHANIANVIAGHLYQQLPLLCHYCYNNENIWWTGSQVWAWLYPGYVNPKSDFDIVCVGSNATSVYGQALTHLVSLGGMAITKATKYGTGNGSDCNLHGKDIDLWYESTSIREVLIRYPEFTHAHCRAAYSFTEGLFILPNSQGW